MNRQISILGCGWLGLPLAKELVANGYKISGSTTSESKLSILEDDKIKPFLIKLNESTIEGDIAAFLKDVEILIIDIPPGVRKDASVSFVSKMKTLVFEIEKSIVKKLIFISSTSVYEDTFPITEITEETTTNPNTESGKQLVEVEGLLRENTHFETTIIRFGGLFGEDRNPSKFVLKKEMIDNPEAPINFIDQKDCIEIIKILISKGLRDVNWNWNVTFNAVAPNHPTRAEYYSQQAKEMNLKVPTFAYNIVSKGKKVSSHKLQHALHYTFQKLF